MVYRVFLSSTSQDLVTHREEVLAAIVRLDGFDPIAMENFGARADAGVKFDDRKMRESHVVVGLLGLCYGSHPRAGPPSFTEREYESALAAGIDRLMLVSPDDFLVPGHLIEADAKRRYQQAFRLRVKGDLIVDGAAAFASPAALARAVVSALANWRAGREKVDEITAELVAAKEAAAGHEARAAELERTLAEGQKEREALRAAVQALARQANEPDAPPKFEQALGLLREGKSAEAEAIFADLIAHKEAEGTAALREAAEAARHLGALASLGGTQKAIAAYMTATRLDPEHSWSWIFLGRLSQQAGNLAAAEQAFLHAQEAAKAAGNERDVMVVHNELGDVQTLRGESATALTSYEAGLVIARKLATQDPGNAGWQRDLSVSLEKIGEVQSAQGDLGAALKAYQDSLAIGEKLAAQDPGNADCSATWP
jgi:tetratricopeptide (TPR) repeat protein